MHRLSIFLITHKICFIHRQSNFVLNWSNTHVELIILNIYFWLHFWLNKSARHHMPTVWYADHISIHRHWFIICINIIQIFILQKYPCWHESSSVRPNVIHYMSTSGTDLSFPSPQMQLLTPIDAIWRHGTWTTLVQIMICCLTAPSHYLNQCWLIPSQAQWHFYEGCFTTDASAINH